MSMSKNYIGGLFSIFNKDMKGKTIDAPALAFLYLFYITRTHSKVRIRRSKLVLFAPWKDDAEHKIINLPVSYFILLLRYKYEL